MVEIKILAAEFNLFAVNNNFALAGGASSEGLGPLERAQKFFCDFLPVAADFIYVLNSVRASLHDLQHAKTVSDDERLAVQEHVNSCDRRLVQAYDDGLDWLANRAYRYFEARRKNKSSTVALVTFFRENRDQSGGFVTKGLRHKSVGVREEPKEFELSKHSVLAFLKQKLEEGQKVKATYIGNVPSAYKLNQFVHPSLKAISSKSGQMFAESYEGFWPAKIVRWKNVLPKKTLDHWQSLWNDGISSLGSIAAFPVTLANNELSEIIEAHFFGPETGLDKQEVFSAVVFESEGLNAFDLEDMLFGKILADCMFVFDGAMTHYFTTSMLRKQFGNAQKENRQGR